VQVIIKVISIVFFCCGLALLSTNS